MKFCAALMSAKRHTNEELDMHKSGITTCSNIPVIIKRICFTNLEQSGILSDKDLFKDSKNKKNYESPERKSGLKKIAKVK